MAEGAIVFAMANPDPEVDPNEAAQHAAVVATGRSDFPNQINNVLAFPGRLPRAARRAARKSIPDEVLLAAAQALAGVVVGRGAQRGVHRAERLPPRRHQGRRGRGPGRRRPRRRPRALGARAGDGLDEGCRPRRRRRDDRPQRRLAAIDRSEPPAADAGCSSGSPSRCSSFALYAPAGPERGLAAGGWTRSCTPRCSPRSSGPVARAGLPPVWLVLLCAVHAAGQRAGPGPLPAAPRRHRRRRAGRPDRYGDRCPAADPPRPARQRAGWSRDERRPPAT